MAVRRCGGPGSEARPRPTHGGWLLLRGCGRRRQVVKLPEELPLYAALFGTTGLAVRPPLGGCAGWRRGWASPRPGGLGAARRDALQASLAAGAVRPEEEPLGLLRAAGCRSGAAGRAAGGAARDHPQGSRCVNTGTPAVNGREARWLQRRLPRLDFSRDLVTVGGFAAFCTLALWASSVGWRLRVEERG
mmetsp:Transcript_92687/g.299849  ORF Transcript_92687/g.299849 Transcript_92687/m.299849 type:complete len:190 (+) Transcript_92687:70-639(+)